MEPIISPWWFYFASVCSHLNAVCVFGLLIIMVLTIATLPEIFKEDRRYKTARKILLIISIVLVFGLVFIPSRQDIYMMMAAKTITYDNISAAKDSTLDFVEKVANTIRQNQNKE